jgi:hypothetical protein
MDAQTGLIILAVLYFLPGITAYARGHMSAAAIVALNLLLGWTLIGWVAAMVWSLTGNTLANARWLATGERPDGIGRFVDGSWRKRR